MESKDSKDGGAFKTKVIRLAKGGLSRVSSASSKLVGHLRDGQQSPPKSPPSKPLITSSFPHH